MDRMIASNSGTKVAPGELEDNNGITLAGKTSAIQTWQKTLKALLEGKIDEAIDQFGDEFTFTDHALELKFSEKERLHEYFAKIRVMFPDSKRVDQTLSSNANTIVSEWTIKDTQSEPFAYGRFLKINIEAHGVSVVRVTDGRIVKWSEYYDQVGSRRYRLAGQFSDWCEV
jgi:ketosteroid isomerase-like protein